MRNRKQLSNDNQRKRFLKNVLMASRSPKSFGENLLDPVLVIQAEDHLRKLNDLEGCLVIAKGARKIHQDACREVLSKFGRSVRNRWNLVHALAENCKSFRAMVEAYGMDERGNRPKVNSFWHWLDHGSKILDGEAYAAANELPILGEWGQIAAFKAEYDAALEEYAKFKAAAMEEQSCIDGMQAVRNEIHDLSVVVARYFDYIMAQHSDERRRSIMRHYGFIFGVKRKDGEDNEPSGDEGLEDMIADENEAEGAPEVGIEEVDDSALASQG